MKIRIDQKINCKVLFYSYLTENQVDLDIDIYEPEIYSGYRLFDDSYKNLRNSSYDLTIK